MVLRTAAPFLLLGIVAANLVLLPTVTHSYTISQSSDDGDLVFVDELDHHRRERSTSSEKEPSLRRSDSSLLNTTKSVSSVKSAGATLLEDDSLNKAVPIIGSNDEGLPQAIIGSQRNKRQYPSYDDYNFDDEDMGQDFGSGEDVVEGSGHGSGLYRVKMRVDGEYLPNYNDKFSAQFASMAAAVQYPLEEELKNQLSGQVSVRLTRIRRSAILGQLELLVDITHPSDQSEESTIREILNEFEYLNKMGSLTGIIIDQFSEEQDPYKNYCDPSQVLCGSGTCATRCDGVSECPNNEDEEQCEPSFDNSRTIATPVEVDLSFPDVFPPVDSGIDASFPPFPPLATTTSRPDCSSDQFKCRDDGTCIENFYQCDGRNDCLDGSDEAPSGCGGCLPSHHLCASEDKCLPSWSVCDNNPDCQDGSDENLQQCCVTGFWCDGICMDINVNCNGILECQDKTDEMGCPQLPVTCRTDQFQCNDGSCIENFQRCDKAQDCRDNEDETNCPCQAPNYECLSGMCISADKSCDGFDDCDDGSDEFSCPCGESEFECLDDGQCIPADEKCDGVANCYDESDEMNCPSCSGDSFWCGNGQCIEQDFVCDGDDDCDTDELNCPGTDRVCSPGFFRCEEGTCIPITQRCDGTYNCPDASDEDECDPVECRPDQWQCRDTACILRTQKCDGRPDCYDRSDEQDCAGPPSACLVGEFQCKDGNCVPESVRCDGQVYCHDGSDEHDCESRPPGAPGCGASEWQCQDGTCLPDYLRCDGTPHCSDRSDEADCPVVSCGSGEWRCLDGTCIPDYLKCDGPPHCPDRSDESDCPVGMKPRLIGF